LAANIGLLQSLAPSESASAACLFNIGSQSALRERFGIFSLAVLNVHIVGGRANSSGLCARSSNWG